MLWKNGSATIQSYENIVGNFNISIKAELWNKHHQDDVLYQKYVRTPLFKLSTRLWLSSFIYCILCYVSNDEAIKVYPDFIILLFLIDWRLSHILVKYV